MRRILMTACLAALPAQAQAQKAQGGTMLEAGIVGGSSPACPGHYVGISGRVAGPVSLYGMVEHYRCVDLAGSANRLGASVRIGRSSWFARPSLRAGIELDGDDVSPTAGVGLTMGRRHGARAIVHVGEGSGTLDLVLFQMGGYVSF